MNGQTRKTWGEPKPKPRKRRRLNWRRIWNQFNAEYEARESTGVGCSWALQQKRIEHWVEHERGITSDD